MAKAPRAVSPRNRIDYYIATDGRRNHINRRARSPRT